MTNVIDIPMENASKLLRDAAAESKMLQIVVGLIDSNPHAVVQILMCSLVASENAAKETIKEMSKIMAKLEVENAALLLALSKYEAMHNSHDGQQ